MDGPVRSDGQPPARRLALAMRSREERRVSDSCVILTCVFHGEAGDFGHRSGARGPSCRFEPLNESTRLRIRRRLRADDCGQADQRTEIPTPRRKVVLVLEDPIDTSLEAK